MDNNSAKNGVWSLNLEAGAESPSSAGGGYMRQLAGKSAALAATDEGTPGLIRSTLTKPTALAQLRPIEDQIFVHLKWNYHGYAIYSEYYFEAWTTLGENGPAYPVDSLVLRWRHGSVTGEEAGVNTSMVAKSDRTYNLGTDTDLCGIVIARHKGGEPWGTTSPTGCVWK